MGCFFLSNLVKSKNIIGHYLFIHPVAKTVLTSLLSSICLQVPTCRDHLNQAVILYLKNYNAYHVKETGNRASYQSQTHFLFLQMPIKCFNVTKIYGIEEQPNKNARLIHRKFRD